MSKVLLTRPKKDGLKTSLTLKRFLIQSLCLPLIEIKKEIHPKIYSSEYDIFLFTSKNGVRNFKIDVKELTEDRITFAVGRETKNLLVDCGFKNVISVNGNLEDLKKGMVKYLKKGLRILHPTSSKNKNLEQFFFKYKCNYSHLKCYSAFKVNKNKKLFERFMISENDKIIAIFSSFTAKSFVEQVIKLNLSEHCKDKIFIVISENVRNELECLGRCNIEIANRPNENEMINLIIKKYRG